MSDRQKFIDGLRELATFLEDHAGVPVPEYTTLNVFVHDKASVTAAARSASWDKIHNGEWFYLRRTFAGNIDFDVTTEREVVCRKVVKGTTIVPAQPERVIEDVEWMCDEPLLAETPHV